MIRLSPDAVLDLERLRTFLDENNPDASQHALARIRTAIERLQEFPALGIRTRDADVRQIVIRFGASGHVVRYVAEVNDDIVITRIWHGREARV
jgi:plasmid stabilization system protein ParE